MQGNRLQVTGGVLKIIAIITMTIDHIGASVLEGRLYNGEGVSEVNYYLLSQVDNVLRIIGRLAFPIFIFLLVEGFRHTHSKGKYALRLGLFCLISEIPFDLAIYHRPWNPYSQNVFFTLLIGFLVIWGMDTVANRFPDVNPESGHILPGNLLIRMTIDLLLLALGSYGALTLHTDYDAGGVIAIATMYLFSRMDNINPDYTKSRRLTAFGMMVLILAMSTGTIELWALIDLVFIWTYNGERGRQMKYFFYAYYPAHLLLLSGIAYLVMPMIR